MFLNNKPVIATAVNADRTVLNNYTLRPETPCRRRLLLTYSSHAVALLKFKLLYKTATGCFLRHHFCGSNVKLNQVNEFCISQGSAVTSFRCGGQIQNPLRHIFSAFLVRKLIKIGSFSIELFQKIKGWIFWTTMYTYSV